MVESLLGLPEDWRIHWWGMPSFAQRDLEPLQTIQVHFRSAEDREEFAKLLGRNLTSRTRAIWFPREEIEGMVDQEFVSSEPANPRHPVYVISKGRWESRLTSRALEYMGVPYRIVVEPQERDRYAEVIDPSRILVLPFSDLGKGSIPARNWVWDHSISEGATSHWILDDNIRCFFRLINNQKKLIGCGNAFRAAEDFVDRYENVALSGFQYKLLQPRKSIAAPYRLNTRIYSCILIRNDIPYRWRGRYNEDTDLSLRALKDGWCTVLFNAFRADKMSTMPMSGGNMDELYQGDGRWRMAESLRRQHPDVVTVVQKWGRWQHHVDYGRFKRNRLKPRKTAYVQDGVDDYGMYLRKSRWRERGTI